MSTYNNNQIENIMQNPANIVHSYVLSCWPNMVNRILSIIEMAIDSESRQYSRVKKSLNTIVYRSRNNILLNFNYSIEGSDIDKKDIFKFLYEEFLKMQENIENIINITFSNEKQRNSISQAIGEIEREVLSDLNKSLI